MATERISDTRNGNIPLAPYASGAADSAGADYSLLETIMTRVMRTFFPAIAAGPAQADFWAVYQKFAEVYDREFAKKCDEDLNTTLIFAGLFSAVTSAFIIDIQGDLKPDYVERTTILLLILIQEVKNLNSSGVSLDLPSFDWSPDPIIVTVQGILYASLASSLLAAFLAVLGKQWLNRYVRGKDSGMERGFDRQVKLDGMKRWYFSIVMEVMPLMLQAALLLFGCALSRYLWTINHIVAKIVLAFTALGALVYILLVIIATFSYACPYQTPFSIVFRYMLEFDANHTKIIHRLGVFLSSVFKRLSSNLVGLYTSTHAFFREWTLNEITLPIHHPDASSNSLPNDVLTVEPLFITRNRKKEIRRHVLNAACISWILDHSTDRDVTRSAIQYIPNVAWHPHVKMASPPIDLLHESVHECFDRSGILIPGSRDNAYTSFKALVHCLVYENTRRAAVPGSYPRYLHGKDFPPIRYSTFDSELKNIMIIYSCITESRDIWEILPTIEIAALSQSHLVWLSHVFVHYAWWRQRSPNLERTDSLGAVLPFIQGCFSQSYPSLLPRTVALNFVTLMGLALGIPFHVDDLSVTDKSENIDVVITRICALLDNIPNRSPVFNKKEHLIRSEVLGILILNANHPRISHHWATAIQSLRNVLSKIFDSDVADKDKQEAVRLVLKLEARMDPTSDLSTDDLSLDGILYFLSQQIHLPIHEREEWYEESIEHALTALHKSVHGNVPLLWDKGVIGHLRHTLDEHRSDKAISVALKIIRDILIGATRTTPETFGSSLSVGDKSEKLDVLVCQMCSHLDRMPWENSSSPRTEHKTRIDVLRILLLSTNRLKAPTLPSHGTAAIQSLRSLFSKFLDSDATKSDKMEAANLIFDLESRMGSSRRLKIENYHLDSVFRFLEQQVRLPLDERPDWYEENIVAVLAALHDSVPGNESWIWDKGIIGCVRLTLDAHRPGRATVLSLAIIRDLVIGATQITPRPTFCEDSMPLTSDVVISQMCWILDNMARGTFPPAWTEHTMRVEVLKILLLNRSHPRISHHWTFAIQSLRNALSRIFASTVGEVDKRMAARLVLELESKMDPTSALQNHQLDSIFLFLDQQLQFRLDPPLDWREEGTEYALVALEKSAPGNEWEFWNKGIVGHLHRALSADCSARVREVTLSLIKSLNGINSQPWMAPKIRESISSILLTFWNNLTTELQMEYAEKYVSALELLSNDPDSCPLIFHDHWKTLRDLFNVYSGAEQFAKSSVQKMASRLPALIREERSNMEVTRVWLNLARRFGSYPDTAVLYQIEVAAAEVLGADRGKPEEILAVSGYPSWANSIAVNGSGMTQ